MPELKGHYFLTAEDGPTKIQDHYLTTLEVIGRRMHRKGDEAQDLTEFFDNGRLPVITVP